MPEESALSEMGINHPEKITHYRLRADGKDKDILTIFYKRKKNSFLPHRKTYSFGRAAKMIKPDRIGEEMKEIFEISPFLQKAMTELDLLVVAEKNKTFTKKEILREIEILERDFKSRMSDIKKGLEKL